MALSGDDVKECCKRTIARMWDDHGTGHINMSCECPKCKRRFLIPYTTESDGQEFLDGVKLG